MFNKYCDFFSIDIRWDAEPLFSERLYPDPVFFSQRVGSGFSHLLTGSATQPGQREGWRGIRALYRHNQRPFVCFTSSQAVQNIEDYSSNKKQI